MYDVENYVFSCETCQQIKNRPQQPYSLLLPNKILGGSWKIITIDLITQLPELDGYNAICVIVDRLSKQAHFYPITNKFSARNFAMLLYKHIYPLHGLSLQIISDKGT